MPLPLLEIVPAVSDEDRHKIKSIILNLDHYQHIIFVSQNAVEKAFEWIDSYWPQLPVGAQLYAVGSKTAAAVQRHQADVTVCGEAMNSEALLALPDLLPVDGHKVLICRGKGGRPKLADVLLERGAKVDYCELYERRLPERASEQLATQLHALADQYYADRHHIVPVFSGDTLQNLMQVLPDCLHKSRVSLVVPAQRVADMAQALGFTNICVAHNATEASMLAATDAAIRNLSV